MAVKKKGRRASQSKSDRSMGIVESAHDVWLAGLGAVSKAQEEGQELFTNLVREGNEFFSRLVAEGGRVQERGRKAVASSADEVQSVIETRISELRGRAADTWDQIESMFEHRVSGAMAQLGVPTAEDMDRLQHRVDELNESVRRLAEAQGATVPGKTTRGRKKAVGKKAPGRKKISSKKKVSSRKKAVGTSKTAARKTSGKKRRTSR